MATVKENLIAAKALIDTPDKWAHENSMRRIEGGNCLCALDAVSAAIGKAWKGGDEERAALESQVPSGRWSRYKLHPVAQYNDHPDTTHADIMSLFDRAIEAQP